MASTTMTSIAMAMMPASSFRVAQPRRSLVVASAARAPPAEEVTSNGKRRELMFAAAAAALCSVAGMALAEDEPKRGTAEAKKKYAPVCVTMPTARICRN